MRFRRLQNGNGLCNQDQLVFKLPLVYDLLAASLQREQTDIHGAAVPAASSAQVSAGR